MANHALDLLKQHGFFGLAGSDGCRCGDCSVHDIEMSISCRKSSGGYPDFWGNLVRVTCNSLGQPIDAMVEVAHEIARQLRDDMEDGCPIKVRFCTYEQDAKCKCVYCGKERADQAGYLCKDCEGGKTVWGSDIRDGFAFPTIDLPEAA